MTEAQFGDVVPDENRSRERPKRRAWFWPVTMIAVAWILYWNCVQNSDPNAGLYVYLAPAFTLLVSFLFRSDQNRASRVYLLFFLIGVTSLAAEANWISSELRNSVDQDASLLVVFERLPAMIAGLLIPLVLGIGCYIVLADTQSPHGPETAEMQTWLEGLANWLNDNNAPEYAEAAIASLGDAIHRLQSDYHQLASQAQQSNQQMTQLGNACAQASQALMAIQVEVADGREQLGRLSAQIQTATTQMGQLDRQVSEMDSILDQFVDIASHKVLQYAPSEDQDQTRTKREPINA